MTVRIADIPMLDQKCIPRCRRKGNIRKKTNEGSTNQKIDLDSCAICIVSTCSRCIHSMASNDVNGNAAMRAPNSELRLAISLTETMTSEDNSNFRR